MSEQEQSPPLSETETPICHPIVSHLNKHYTQCKSNEILQNVVTTVVMVTQQWVQFVCIMNQQMYNWKTIHYTALYYIAATCFDVIALSLVPAKLRECSIGNTF